MSMSDTLDDRMDHAFPDRIVMTGQQLSSSKLRMPRLHYLDAKNQEQFTSNYSNEWMTQGEREIQEVSKQANNHIENQGSKGLITEGHDNHQHENCLISHNSNRDLPCIKILVASIVEECEAEINTEINDLIIKHPLSPGVSNNVDNEVPVASDNNTNREFPVHTGVDLSSHYNDKQLIGKGKFGHVYKVKHVKNGNFAAAKEIVYRTQEAKEGILHEIEILKCLSESENIVQLYEVIDSCHTKPKTMIIVTEYLEGGDLFEQIAKDDLLTETKIVHIMKQLLKGVAFIHSKGIIHRDIKPENIVYCSEPFQNIKIIDFGFAVHYDKDNPPKSMVGTTIFVAPEVLRFECQSFQTDIWSLGVLAYDLLAGITPFEIPRSGDLDRELTDAEIIENIERCIFDFDDDGFIGVSEDGKHFISKLIVREPEKRMTLDQCLKHPWLNEGLKPNTHISIQRAISVERMKNYKSMKNWEKIGMAIHSVKLFKSSSDN